MLKNNAEIPENEKDTTFKVNYTSLDQEKQDFSRIIEKILRQSKKPQSIERHATRKRELCI